MKDEQQKQVIEGGHATFSVKVTQETYDLVNILCEGLEYGTNGNDLVKMFIHAFIESAKHDGPISPDMQQFLDLLTLDPGWNKAFNFADATARMEVAQVILVLQQKNRSGFGLTMIDKPWMGHPKMTMCLDSIFERMMKIAMPGIYKRLKWIGEKFYCTSLREVLTLLCEYISDSIKKEEDQHEMPCYGNYHDFGRAIEYGNKHKRKPHRTPDSVANSQQRIVFDDDDREVADYEAKNWEGIHRNPENDEPPAGMPRPFDQEY